MQAVPRGQHGYPSLSAAVAGQTFSRCILHQVQADVHWMVPSLENFNGMTYMKPGEPQVEA